MKKLMTVFFDKGVMKSYESLTQQYATIKQYNQALEAARDAALPVAEESREMVSELIWMQTPLKEREDWINNHLSVWQLDQTKSYNVECDMREKKQFVVGYANTKIVLVVI